LLKDILIAGQDYYRVKSSPKKTNIVIEVLDPLNTFPDYDANSPYVNESSRIVVRRWMTKT
jgi:hypothetical protein